MKFFLDTAEISEIRELAASGLVDGITTNPSLVMKSGRQFVDVVREICEIVPGPVSAEVISTDHETMLAEGRKLAKIEKHNKVAGCGALVLKETYDAAIAQGYRPQGEHRALSGVTVGGVAVPLDLVAVA